MIVLVKALYGTTSACAENTPHPHANNHHEKELPPRARRILKVAFYCEYESGTTSACAENTLNELGLL